MYKEIIIPTENDFVIHFPDNFIGKTVEVIAFTQEEAMDSQEVSKKRLTLEEFRNKFRKYKRDLSDWKFDRDEANDYSKE